MCVRDSYLNCPTSTGLKLLRRAIHSIASWILVLCWTASFGRIVLGSRIPTSPLYSIAVDVLAYVTPGSGTFSFKEASNATRIT